MPEYVLNIDISNTGTRNEVRMRVVEQFALEEAGTGSGDSASKYTYYVETMQNGDRIYLRRPANLHNGFDFLVCVENQNFAGLGERRRNYPKHEDIENDLNEKKAFDPVMYRALYELLERVYNCQEVSETEMREVHFSCGLPVDHVVKIVKWLFIEQDIRYWNYSGRNMTWGIVPEI